MNGTACAIPRILMAIITSNQKPKGVIEIPEVLRPYMKNAEEIRKQKNSLTLSVFKGKAYEGTVIKE